MLIRFLQNHVLANLTFMIVLVMGILSYIGLPRELNPTINFNWIDITTLMPGASAEDVEKQVTNVLEDAVRGLADIRFVASTSREGVSNVLVRFRDIDQRTFDKRLNDLRREIQNKERELPAAAETPRIFEITSSNSFPVATLVVVGRADDENLRQQAKAIKEDLERFKGVDGVVDMALHEPELQVNFLPQRLEAMGITPNDLADTVIRYYRDVPAGTVQVNRRNWLVRLIGTDSDPDYLASLPVVTAQGEVPLGNLAMVERSRQKPDALVRFNNQPAIMLAVNKKAEANLLQLVDQIKAYIDVRNPLSHRTGVQLVLVDDLTQNSRSALRLMQNNALLGLLSVLLVSWVFLGTRIAVFTCIGIPFVLAGTFWVLSALGQTLNVTVLLGIVISLGMLVDDAVVVVEAVFYRLQRGMAALPATLAALREVFAPVTTAVLTTMAAFLPLMLLPGILGKFMLVIPLVVATALAISLIEAYWMLPAHVIKANISFARPSRIHACRIGALRRIRRRYTRLLVGILRRPKRVLAAIVLLFAGTVAILAGGMIKFDFFAGDGLRLFYVNVEMPAGTPLEETLAKTLEVEDKIRAQVRADELRAMVRYAGQAFAEKAPLYGEHYGQIMVGLHPRKDGLRDVDELIETLREDVEITVGPHKISFLSLSSGPPTARPISIKVRGDDIVELRRAVHGLKSIMADDPALVDITDDDSPGLMEFELRVNRDAAKRAGIDPAVIARALGLLVDGEVVASLQDRGEELNVRVRAQPIKLDALDQLLRTTLPLPTGARISLAELVHQDYRQGQGNIRHYNFRRTITVEADIDKTRTDTVAANERILQGWDRIRANYPGVNLDFSGELDDIQESLASIQFLFLLGAGLIYLILGTQFRSYFQPLLILATIPMAFTGVIMGLLVTGNPLSLYTLYGMVALVGITVNAAIVLISAANDRLRSGMSVLHATLYAARRRVIPILITAVTTIAGLFSLATGLAGHSLVWGPVATAIVWGLSVSTLLTLFIIPLLYGIFMSRRRRREARAERPGTGNQQSIHRMQKAIGGQLVAQAGAVRRESSVVRAYQSWPECLRHTAS